MTAALMHFGTGTARHGIALAAFANQFQNYHRAPVAHRQKSLKCDCTTIIQLRLAEYRYHVLSKKRGYGSVPKGGRQRLDFKSSSLPVVGKASMRGNMRAQLESSPQRENSQSRRQTSCCRIPASGTTLSLSQPRRVGRIPNDVQSTKINLITLHIWRIWTRANLSIY